VNIQDLKTYTEYAAKADVILGRQIAGLVVKGRPVTEKDIIDDVIAEVKRIMLSNRDIVFPGLAKAQEWGIIYGAIAQFKEKVKKDIMPIQFAKADNLIVEPIYRPHIFGIDEFSYTTPAAVPGTVTLLNYDLTTADTVDKEMFILTDIVLTDAEPPITEILITVDGEDQKALSFRKDIQVSDLHIYELPFPVVADISLKIDARAEVASTTGHWLPIGLHICLGSIHKGLTSS